MYECFFYRSHGSRQTLARIVYSNSVFSGFRVRIDGQSGNNATVTLTNV
jgi:hypothetical protein